MTADLATMILGIIAVGSIISQIIVEIISSVHQSKIKKIEINQEIKANLFSDYLKSLEHYVYDGNSGARYKYKTAYGNALLYATGNALSIMRSIDKQLDLCDNKSKYLDSQLDNLVSALQKSLK